MSRSLWALFGPLVAARAFSHIQKGVSVFKAATLMNERTTNECVDSRNGFVRTFVGAVHG